MMWEVMSYGERPYWNWSNQDVIKSIEKVCVDAGPRKHKPSSSSSSCLHQFSYCDFEVRCLGPGLGFKTGYSF